MTLAVVVFGAPLPMHACTLMSTAAAARWRLPQFVSFGTPVFCRGGRLQKFGPQALGPLDFQRTRRFRGGPVDKAADEYEIDAGDDPEYVADNLQDYSDLVVRDGIARGALLRKAQK